MAKRIIWSLNAQNDRKSILEYWNVRNRSKNYSRRLYSLFNEAIKLIAIYPESGRLTDIEGVRFTIVKDYLIFYEELTNVILILRIWDSRRNPDTIKLQD